jgi:hypothetical protein
MKKMLIKTSILMLFLCISIPQIWSQPPPPANHSETDNQVPGGGAPIGNGTFLLLNMALIYSCFKVNKISNKEKKA